MWEEGLAVTDFSGIRRECYKGIGNPAQLVSYYLTP